ncbi:MAG: PAS domain-containing protein [Burkholderiales bacterium]|nr:PAS domain-containing protein [Burkholderiales bacterium]
MATRKSTARKRPEPRAAAKATTTAPAAVAPAAATPAGRFTIVGLGASAGGLEAFEQFFRAMPADSGMGFVLVQHLDPSHASILTEILQRNTAMPVVEAQDQMRVEPNRVHVIPPNRDMVIFGGALQLSVPTEPRGQRMPIDAFLRSLAEDRGDAAVGIVLSGTGTDGTLGLRAVHGAGGLCLVQDPATARYDGMPASAIRAGYATRVLTVDKMPQALQAGTRSLPIGPIAAASAPGAVGGLNQILMLLRSATGHDFSQYKKSTIGRRIERRMAQHDIEDAQVYARHLKEHPAELQTLFRELLINVTSFFRDPLAFVALKHEILPALLAGKPDGHVLRVWVAGGASGEEAYSIAMLLRELMDETRTEFKVQMYSTDIDDQSIATARAGMYPPNVAQDISPERLRRFFVKEEGGYRVRKEIREMVVFAVQSVIKDPPFTRLDLLACRNLLIYLEPELQNRLMMTFHYALRPGGVLFLSPSESVGSHTELFEPIDRKWKLYRAKPGIASTRAVLESGLAWAADRGAPAPPGPHAKPRESDLADLTQRALLESFAPAAVLTDLQGNVLYVHGETGRFLRPAPGRPSHNVVEMAREGLQVELREALHEAAAPGAPAVARTLHLHTDGAAAEPAVGLSVRPLRGAQGGAGLLLVSFRELAETAPPKPRRRPKGGAPADAARLDELRGELESARRRMTSMLEEQQASNEELMSTNEELQSTNEELQSTNEELETSKEELQSVNEELVTVNSELQGKIEQMAAMQDDMKNLLDNIRVGTIFLDRQLRIRRYTRDAVQVYRLVTSDVGRPLADIRSELQGIDLLADAQTVLDTLVPIEREARTAAGTWYLARIQPYRTVDNVIDGVVLTFTDVTERVQVIAARKARDLAEAIVDAMDEPLIVLDGTLEVVSANRAYYHAFGGAREGTVGHRIFELGDRLWDFASMHELLETVLPREHRFENRVVEHTFAGLGRRRLQLGGRRLADPGDGTDLVLLAIELLDTKQV